MLVFMQDSEAKIPNKHKFKEQVDKTKKEHIETNVIFEACNFKARLKRL